MWWRVGLLTLLLGCAARVPYDPVAGPLSVKIDPQVNRMIVAGRPWRYYVLLLGRLPDEAVCYEVFVDDHLYGEEMVAEGCGRIVAREGSYTLTIPEVYWLERRRNPLKNPRMGERLEEVQPGRLPPIEGDTEWEGDLTLTWALYEALYDPVLGRYTPGERLARVRYSLKLSCPQCFI